jgi:tRNA(His) 5'-end guanylyltransferase
LQEKLFQEKGINWNDLPSTYKRGSTVLKNKLNDNIPIFSQNKQYFEGVF